MKLKLTWLLTLFMAFVMQFSFAQEKTVTGTVTTAEDGLPLPGASVVVKGTSRGQQTDFDGKYTIKVNQGDVLVISYVGMKNSEVTIGGSNTYNVTLQLDGALDEVLVVGYGNQTRETVTSAVNSVSAAQIEERPTASLAQALQARAPGLNISTGNGQPGNDSRIILRGVGSINGNVEPLFIIDDVPVDEDNFRSLNQNDIETISILKDASATAIYGNRGAGGVILVTTKRGRQGQKTEIRYNGFQGVAFKPVANFTLANSRQLLNIERAAGAGTGSGDYNPYIGEVLGLSPTPGTPLTDAEIDRLSQVDTDWADILLRQGTTTNHNISISSGSENMTSFTSLGYFDQEGITLRSKLQRLTVRNNSSYTKNRFRLVSSLQLGFSRSDLPGGIGGGTGGSGSLSNPFIVPFVGKPYLSPFNADGSPNLQGNPDFDDEAGFLNTPYVAQNVAQFDTNRETEIKIVGGLTGSYDITDNWSVSSTVGMDFTEQTDFFLQPATNSIRGNQSGEPDQVFKGSQFEQFIRDTRMNVDARLNYNNTFADKHNVNVVGVVEFLYAENSGFSFNQNGLVPGLEGTGAGFVAGTTTEDPDGDGNPNFFYIPTLGSFKNNVSQFSYFGRVNYDYDRMFGVDLTLRRDASSRFNSTNKWGTFGAVGAFWNLTKSVIEPSDIVNNLKLRGSWGVNGNDRVSNAYYGGLVIPFDLFNTGTGYNGTVGLGPSLIGNPDLKWEVVTQTNVGLDFALFNNRLTGSFDLYEKVTTDLFIGRPNTAISGGFTNINANVGTMENRGVELLLNYTIAQTDDFFWSISANGSYNRNRITSLPGSEPNQFGEVILDDAQGAVEAEGQPFNSFYAVPWAGVNPATGNPLYRTRDGELTETFNLEDRVFSDRSSLPLYQGGFGTSISYKGWSLDALFSFAAEVYRENGTLGVAEDTGLINISNVSSSLLTAWSQPGDVTGIPSLNSASVRLLNHDRYIEDASYLRMKNISFGYAFNSDQLEDIFINSLRLFVQGENLLTWTKWRGFDPEFDPFATNDFFTFPNARIVTFGVDIKF